jgi:hypothetical protein
LRIGGSASSQDCGFVAQALRFSFIGPGLLGDAQREALNKLSLLVVAK